ncbi:MAG TPA: glycosyl hydrolase family 28 protein [Candidatus Binatia bacterium]|nr:glycosyl hydrolase family 28 protein [Candidatus Binatia bacterium]
MSRRRFIRTSVLLGGGGLAGTAVGAASARAEDTAPDAVFDVRRFGAVGNGRTKCTRVLQHALDAAHRAGGGTVVFPAGDWLTGTLHLRSRVALELAPGATLVASRDDDDFAPRDDPPFATGSDVETIDFAHALLAGHDLEHVTIAGRGTIDMNRSRRFGPKPIALKRCRFVTVAGIAIVHSPNYCVSLGGCEDVLVDGVTIREAYSDGIDPDCCRRVRIANCDVEADDDALCLKASLLLGARAATEDVLVANCRLKSPSNCFKLGTESTGDFRQVVLANCVFSGRRPTHRDVSDAVEGGGIAILSVDGGTIDGVSVSNVVMEGVDAPLFVRLGNRGRDQPRRIPGKLRNVSLSGIVATGATGTGSIAGLVAHPVEGITLANVRISTAADGGPARGLAVPEREDDYPKVTMYGALPAFGLYVRHARDVVLRDVALAAEGSDARPALVADDVVGLQVAGLSGRTVRGTGPFVWLHEVRGGLLQGNLVPEDVGVFLRVTGEHTQGIALGGNGYRSAGPVEVAPEIAPEAVTDAGGPVRRARQA